MKLCAAFFLLTLAVHAQDALTKTLFYNLPIDKSKAEVINAIKSDTALFHTVDSAKIDVRYNVQVRKNPENLPVPVILPSITVLDNKTYYDSLIQKEYRPIVLMLTYKRHFGSFKNAKKAYSTIVKRIEQDYSVKSDIDTFYGKNKTSFKLNKEDNPICSVHLAYNLVRKNNRPDKSKCIIYVTYSLK
ncbi:MAG: hypothetical protein V4565_05350 [Bacteroidota bacterium]